jgi:hypothetical protein
MVIKAFTLWLAFAAAEDQSCQANHGDCDARPEADPSNLIQTRVRVHNEARPATQISHWPIGELPGLPDPPFVDKLNVSNWGDGGNSSINQTQARFWLRSHKGRLTIIKSWRLELDALLNEVQSAIDYPAIPLSESEEPDFVVVHLGDEYSVRDSLRESELMLGSIAQIAANLSESIDIHALKYEHPPVISMGEVVEWIKEVEDARLAVNTTTGYLRIAAAKLAVMILGAKPYSSVNASALQGQRSHFSNSFTIGTEPHTDRKSSLQARANALVSLIERFERMAAGSEWKAQTSSNRNESKKPVKKNEEKKEE